MRVTNKMLSNNFLRDMSKNLNNLNTIQGQMDSGKQIRKPSDDPAKASRIMRLYSDIGANEQYNANIKNTTNWLDMTDTALDHVGEVVKSIDELLISTGDPAYGGDQKQAIKDALDQKVGELSQILNTSFDGKYIFGGTRGDTKPVEAKPEGDSINQLGYFKGDSETDPNTPKSNAYNQINSKLLVEVSQGVTMDYNITASQVINYGEGDNNLITLLSNITKHLDSSKPDDIKELANGDLAGIKEVMTNVLKLRSEVGAKQNRMESAEARNVDQKFNMTEILSSTEDINITEKAMEYATMQTIYMASLQTSAKVLQPTLLDYLR